MYFHLSIPHPTISPLSLYKELGSNSSHRFLFESASEQKTANTEPQISEKGRYTLMGFDVLDLFEVPALSNQNAIELLKKRLATSQEKMTEELPFPFSPAYFGCISFEVARHTQNIALPFNEGILPDALLFMPKQLIVIDHAQKTTLLLASEPELLQRLHLRVVELNNSASSVKEISLRAQTSGILPENMPLPSRRSFDSMFARAQELIKAGDVMQLVISQKMKLPATRTPVEIYSVLRENFPAPYMYVFESPHFSVIGSSPETLVKVQGKKVTIRPIAGTRSRGTISDNDEKLTTDLLNDPKERAEHEMLVDLGRNDLGKVCTPSTVHVTKHFTVEKMNTIMHLVSEIQGELADDMQSLDAFSSCFPAGTLSGAPKRRAIQRIYELEKEPRGIYGGAVGYIATNGTMDFAIAIRTILHTGTTLRLQAGAGIVADSRESFEDRECRIKMKSQYLAATY